MSTAPAVNLNTAPPKKATGARQLKDWLQSYVEYTQETEAPREFHLWTGISTIAGALGRKCWIDMGRFTLYPSFYIIFVAPPGIATKSTTAGIGVELLETTKTATLFQGSITWQAVLDQLKDGEKLIDIEGKKFMMSSLQVFASELGVLLKKEDNSMVDLLVDLWDGKNKIERRTRGGGNTEISRPYLNLIGCTTPAWLSSYAESYMIEGGFFSRTIFVYADEKDRLIPYPDSAIDVELRTALENDLQRISNLRGSFALTEEAREWGTEWYKELWTNPPENIASERFQSYRSRRQTHLHKVAMVLSAAQGDDRIITLEHMVIAEEMLQLAEHHLVTIHESIVSSEKIEAYRLILKTMRRVTSISKNELFNQLSTRITYQEFTQGLEAAVFAGHVKEKADRLGTVLVPVR